ncbi:hypothetical protein K525DRAFT_288797 [Schizophyllum commune Loenen D]|nr:hypothetical protein K525DRAFT_288797 [Schizophyllum commune Loenen D]
MSSTLGVFPGLADQYLLRQDLIALSSTCTALRGLRPLVLASCRWNDNLQPPESVWPLIKHLYIHAEHLQAVYASKFFLELDGLTSLHVEGDCISDELAKILMSTHNLTALDFSSLCYGSGSDLRALTLPTLSCLPPLSCKPRVVKFCSRHHPDYLSPLRLLDKCIRKMPRVRRSCSSLLHQIDVSKVETLEVGMEALSLPFASAYPWTSLTTLVVNGISLHPDDTYEDFGNEPEMRAHAYVHLGTMLMTAPRLRVLRMLCRCYRGQHPHCTAWPADEPPPPSGTAIPDLEELDIRNPAFDEGLLHQLPSSLRKLSLMAYPHILHNTLPLAFYLLAEARPIRGIRTAEELIDILEARPMPDLRQLRLSFRLHADMMLFERITTLFPLLEVLEIHAEIGPGCLWTPDELIDFARTLAPLANLRVLKVSTFNKVLPGPPADDEDWVICCIGEPDEGEDPEEFMEMRMREVRYHRWMNGLRADDIEQAFGPLEGVSEFWLPTMVRTDLRRWRRVWQVYRIARENSLARLCLQPGLTEMVEDGY